MAALQTWGALGTMVAEQHEFDVTTAEYLEANEVYDLFGFLLRQLVIHQPLHPVQFLQHQLRTKPPLSVCVIGPPGINRSRYCSMIATEFRIKHIQVGKLLRRRELLRVIESGELVDDKIVVDIVRSEIQSARSTGWVLDGFPRTKVQAQALSLKEMGFCLDKVLLLNTGEEMIRKRYAAKVAAVNAAKRDELITVRLQQYQRHVISIAELFKNTIRQIEVPSDDEKATFAVIKRNLHVRPYSNAPLRPPRICLVGPCGSGLTSQSRIIAKNYGLIHVDIRRLLKEQQKENGHIVEDVPPEYVSDEELCSCVGKRLNQTDCLRKGWVLDGFPKTKAQAEFLRQAHLWPTRLIHLGVPEEDCVARVCRRRLDPVTCIAYYKNPSSIAVRQRLVQADHDQPDAVRERFALSDSWSDKVLRVFPLVQKKLDASGEMGSVATAVQKFIDDPLPSELAQDPEEPS